MACRGDIFRRPLLGGRSQRLSGLYGSHILDLAFLAPDIMDAILTGTQPATLNAKALTLGPDLPLHWQRQAEVLGVGPTSRWG